MEFGIADGVILGVLLLSGVLAWSRGLTREVLAVAGWAAAAVAALYLAPLLEPLLKEIPTVGQMLASTCSLSKIAAFSVAFAGALVVLSFFTPLLSSAIRDSLLGPIDRGLGFLFGVARGVVLVAAAWLVYDQVVPPADRVAGVDDAPSVRMIADAAGTLRANLPDRAPDWLTGPVEAYMADCGGIPALSRDEAAAAPAAD